MPGKENAILRFLQSGNKLAIVNTIKYIILGIVALMVLIQFVRPKYNLNDRTFLADFTEVYKLPDNIKLVLKKACYDCDSNNTRYPGYSKIQPIAWIMQGRIYKGKYE